MAWRSNPESIDINGWYALLCPPRFEDDDEWADSCEFRDGQWLPSDIYRVILDGCMFCGPFLTRNEADEYGERNTPGAAL